MTKFRTAFIVLILAIAATPAEGEAQPFSSAAPPVQVLSDDTGDYVLDTPFPQWVKELPGDGAAPQTTDCVSSEGLIPEWAAPLPVDSVRCVALNKNETELWIATGDGVVFLDLENKRKLYFHGKRWLPDNDVKSVGVTDTNDAYVTTDAGDGLIARRMMTLEQKALHFEEISQARHNRDGMITNSPLKEHGNPETYYLTDDDNDGQWTQMYLAAESFRYAATGDPDALRNAKDSFRAMVRLMTVSPVKGYPARSVLPIEKCPGGDPERWRDHPVEKDICWKSDTSKDELIGHYLGFPIYYDLVADDEEKEIIRQVIGDTTDRLNEHGMKLVDEQGNVTTYGNLDPEWVNSVGTTGDQGLNSLTALAILISSYHITGKQEYLDEYWKLIKDDSYHKNTLNTKKICDRFAPSHDSDEMASLAFYTLLSYAENPKLREKYFLEGLRRLWEADLPERNPEQAAIYGAFVKKDFALGPAVRTLREIPIDLIEWDVINSHRKDIEISETRDRFGELQSVEMFPYTEARTLRWAINMYLLDAHGGGRVERDATFWLLPYWMMRYHKMIR